MGSARSREARLAVFSPPPPSSPPPLDAALSYHRRAGRLPSLHVCLLEVGVRVGSSRLCVC